MIHRTRSSIRHTFLLAAVALVAAASAPAAAQSVSLGADVVSRYVWRGLDFGESMALQPALTISLGMLEFGAWGSYSISASGAAANENDLWASFTHEFEAGASLSLGVTDYYFPGPGATDFRDGEAHTQEVWVSVSGPESAPLSVYAGLLLDDVDRDDCGEEEDCSVQTLYAEVGGPLMDAEGVELAWHLGYVNGKSVFYQTTGDPDDEKSAGGAAVVNIGVTASTELGITESFAPPVSVSYVVNPARSVNRAYLVFLLSLSP
ncbi:MAG: hypothetical protein OXG18_11650 [Gemmatimonadetes bacterium]|nr:hypothetical protein [Gemmatimonadota bacterium]